jgi:hypothetical protein
MGMFRDGDVQEIDLVKEMAEALGGTGARLEESLDKVHCARSEVERLLAEYHQTDDPARKPSISTLNDTIRDYNRLVDKAQDALRWLLIQREACGFRTHRNVDHFYPIPPKIKTLER